MQRRLECTCSKSCPDAVIARWPTWLVFEKDDYVREQVEGKAEAGRG